MASKVVKAISASGLTIYDSLEARPELYLDTRALERVLNRALVGLDLNYAIRTRSKVLKSSVWPGARISGSEIVSQDSAAISRPKLRHLRPEIQQPANLERRSGVVEAVRLDSGR